MTVRPIRSGPLAAAVLLVAGAALVPLACRRDRREAPAAPAAASAPAPAAASAPEASPPAAPSPEIAGAAPAPAPGGAPERKRASARGERAPGAAPAAEEVPAEVEEDEAQGPLGELRAPVPHCMRAPACDAGERCPPPTAACAPLPDVEPPEQVAGVSAEADSDHRIYVAWTPTGDDVGVVGYEVHEGSRLVAEVTERVTRVDDRGLRPGTRHCYSVTARDAAGNASRPSAPACATTPDLMPPETPPGVVAAPCSGREIVVGWEPSTDDVGVAGYEVLRDGAVVARTDALQARIGGLDPETKYCLAVRAFDAAGNRSEDSAPACAATAPASTPAAPWKLRAQAVRRELRLSWEPSPDPDVVYVVSWDRGRAERPIGTTPAPSFRVFGSPAAERHCYRIVAVDREQRESPRTLPVCAGARAPDEGDGGAGAPPDGAGGR